MLALVPASDDFAVHFGDLEAHREVIGEEVPPEEASEEELRDHLRTLIPLHRPDRPALTAHGMGWTGRRAATKELLQLARSGTYVFESQAGAEVYVGDFTEDMFGQAEPDDELGGVAVVPIAPDYGLVVDDGTVTVATSQDGLAGALDAQQGEADSLADVPGAVQLVEALEALGTIHGVAAGYTGSSIPIAGAAAGVALDSDEDGFWRLVVAHHPNEDGNLDDVTETLERLAADFADERDGEVVEVTTRGGVATATIRIDDPNIWFQLLSRFDPLITGGAQL